MVEEGGLSAVDLYRSVLIKDRKGKTLVEKLGNEGWRGKTRLDGSGGRERCVSLRWG
jgi:hypothetical protein